MTARRVRISGSSSSSRQKSVKPSATRSSNANRNASNNIKKHVTPSSDGIITTQFIEGPNVYSKISSSLVTPVSNGFSTKSGSGSVFVLVPADFTLGSLASGKGYDFSMTFNKASGGTVAGNMSYLIRVDGSVLGLTGDAFVPCAGSTKEDIQAFYNQVASMGITIYDAKFYYTADLTLTNETYTLSTPKPLPWTPV